MDITSLNEFDIGWKAIETASSLNDPDCTKGFSSVIREKLDISIKRTNLSMDDFVAFKINLSAIHLRVSKDNLLCIVRMNNSDREIAEDAFNALILAHNSIGSPEYLTICIVCGENDTFFGLCKQTLLNVVALPINQFRDVIAAPKWTDKLAELLRKDRMVNSLSGYDEHGECDPELFFGRNWELQTLMTQSTSHGFSLVGCRRIGKSSLLLELKRHLELQGQVVYYIDCRSCNSFSEFYTEIIKRTNPKDYKHKSLWSLKDYLIRLAGLQSKKMTNIILDEVDNVIASDKTSGYDLFSELMSAESNQEVQFKIWLAGYKDLYWAVSSKNGPFWGRSRSLELGPLDQISAPKLITLPMHHLGYSVSDNLIDIILKDTSRHPAFVQLYCRLLVDIMSTDKCKVITPEHLSKAKTHNDFRDYVLDNFNHDLSSLERIIVLAILEYDNFSAMNVAESMDEFDISLDYSPLKKELRDLRFSGILQEDDGMFSFRYPVLKDILKAGGELNLIFKKDIKKARKTAGRMNEEAK